MAEPKASSPRTVGQHLEEIRKDLGYTQKEFANKLQIGQQNLSRYESGKLSISLQVIKALYEMGYDTNWLLYEKGYMKIADNESEKIKYKEQKLKRGLSYINVKKIKLVFQKMLILF